MRKSLKRNISVNNANFSLIDPLAITSSIPKVLNLSTLLIWIISRDLLIYLFIYHLRLFNRCTDAKSQMTYGTSWPVADKRCREFAPKNDERRGDSIRKRAFYLEDRQRFQLISDSSARCALKVRCSLARNVRRMNNSYLSAATLSRRNSRCGKFILFSRRK